MSARVGRDGFTGSPLTVWCASCRDWTLDHGDFCLWCEHRVKPTAAQVRRRERDRERAAAREMERRCRDRNAEVNARILQLDAEGRSSRNIAQIVHMSPRAVAYRLRALRQLPTTVGQS